MSALEETVLSLMSPDEPRKEESPKNVETAIEDSSVKPAADNIEEAPGPDSSEIPAGQPDAKTASAQVAAEIAEDVHATPEVPACIAGGSSPGFTDQELEKMEKEMHGLLDVSPAHASPDKAVNLDFDKMGTRDATYAKDLQNVVANGTVPVTSGVSQKMSRNMSATEKTEYKNMSSDSKAAFRISWAKRQLSDIQERFAYVQEWRKVDITKGTYESYMTIWQREGGSKRDLDAATKIIEKCCKMGHPWIRYNTMSERYDYLYIKHGIEETLAKSWALFQEGSSPGGTTTTTASGQSGGSSAQGKEAGTSEKKQDSTKGKSKKNEASKDDTPVPKKAKTSSQDAAIVTKLKNQYSKTVCAALEVQRLTRSNPEWAWAFNDVTLTPMNTAQKVIESAIDENPVISAYINQEVGELKRNEDFENKAKEFQVVFGPLVTALESQVNLLKRMHKARGASA